MSRNRMIPLLASLAIFTLTIESARAQYFGQNQVRRKSFDFRVLKTAHFDIHYYPEAEQMVPVAARMAERWYMRLSKLLEFELTARQPLILYASHPEFQQTNTIGGSPGEGTGGVTEAYKRRIILPFGGSLDETDHVIGHELVHAFQFAITGQGRPGVGFREPALLSLPLWFIEGMAEYLSIGPVDSNTAMWMRDAVARDKLPPIKKLDDPRLFPYRWGHAFWAYVAGRYGDPVVGKILKATGRSKSLAQAIESVLEIKIDDLSKDWHQALRDAYLEPSRSKPELASLSRPLIQRKEGDTRYYIGPSVSPDGDHVVFFSERDLFSIEAFMADARSGEVVERLSRTAVDTHFDSLQFIKSAGAWDAAGRRLVFAAVSQGVPVLTLRDMSRKASSREIRFPQLGEIMTPSFSPAGNAIVFTGFVGGATDLYVYDLDSDQLKRLTNDPFAALHPVWSPDGKSIAFVTDRFTSDLKNLSFGDFRLALFDLASASIIELPGFSHGRHSNPQWNKEGSSLYFLSDRNGASNVYRLDIEKRRLYQVTDLFLGVGGITPLSPAISLSSKSGTLTFSAFQNNYYTIHLIDDADVLAGVAVSNEATRADSSAALLPPHERSNDLVRSMRDDPLYGLPPEIEPSSLPYKPSLSLDYIAQPYIGIGTDRFGTYIGGGTSLFFSDMLGDHNLGLTFQAQGGFNDIALVGAYTNLSSRWDWGISAGQIPYVTGGYGNYYDRSNDAYVERSVIYRQISRSVATYAAYPFNRAKRLEFTTGYHNISFDNEIRDDYYDRLTGTYLGEQKEDLPRSNALNLSETSAAFVHDTSIFGATGPLLGSRYRFEVGQSLGSLNITSLLADYRRYFMPVRPFTFAARVMHYGRYGPGAGDERLVPLFVGYSTLVHGYDTDSFSASECRANDGTCPVFDQLLGERMIVANVELRFPPFGLLGERRFYGPVPIDFAVFFDAGVAWRSGEKPSLIGGEREFVKSVGVAARLNLFGFAVVEAAYVNPLDRPDKKPFWQFGFAPSF
ncbi:MAG: PD40 domain-containing protein [Vicinamibacteria bacterium]|nr:PD40 domain-containing protein [Vicinamibacteria bacterium]